MWVSLGVGAVGVATGGVMAGIIFGTERTHAKKKTLALAGDTALGVGVLGAVAGGVLWLTEPEGPAVAVRLEPGAAAVTGQF